MREQRTSLQVISTGGLYGAERVLLELSAYLHEQNWNTHIVALEGKGAKALVRRAQSLNLSAESFGSDRVDIRTIHKKLSAVAARYPVGIIHSHGYKPDVLLSLPGFARQWIRVSTCHAWYRETWKLRLWEYLDKRVLRRFDAVVPVSGQVKSDLYASAVPAERITRINNGIDAPRCDLALGASIRSEFNLAANDKLVVQIGRLAKSKRNDLLVEAIGLLSKSVATHVVFVGDGDERAAIAALAERLQLGQRVHFAGYRSDIRAFLSAADVLAISSDYEGLPMVLLEAMAAQCPIVSTRVGAVPDVLTEGLTAWLVKPNDASRLAEALGLVLQNRDEASRRANQARIAFETRYSRRAMGEKYLEVYERVWVTRAFPN